LTVRHVFAPASTIAACCLRGHDAGIAAHEWLSPESVIESDIEEFQETHPDAEDIEPVN
jgi:hypothetical protein